VRDRRRRPRRRRIRPASRTLSAPKPQLLMIWPHRKSKNLGVMRTYTYHPPMGAATAESVLCVCVTVAQ